MQSRVKKANHVATANRDTGINRDDLPESFESIKVKFRFKAVEPPDHIALLVAY